ncbi:hypothetical protein ACQR1I_06930 [Bradyrhizobium sp. HKCCYLS2038]
MTESHLQIACTRSMLALSTRIPSTTALSTTVLSLPVLVFRRSL